MTGFEVCKLCFMVIGVVTLLRIEERGKELEAYWIHHYRSEYPQALNKTYRSSFIAANVLVQTEMSKCLF